ncbi:MAG TPA: glycosyltransferase, partial [Burkholderiales bacterium]|nr:glycosyltransferase [Burkholderiales bacterium]
MSIVVPTCCRPLLLQRCLIALTHQRLPHHEYEVVVVDDDWSEETRQLVGRVAADMSAPTMRYLRSPSMRRGPAAARNIGWR